MSADCRAFHFTISTAQRADVDAILALERAIEFAPHWQRKTYEEIIQGMGGTSGNDLQRFLVVAKQADGQLIGFAVCSAHPELPESSVLESVAVAVAARRAGVGRALCEETFTWCRQQGAVEIGLEVRRQSAGVIELYKALGFIQTGMRPAYYSDSADALLMQKDLTASRSIHNPRNGLQPCCPTFARSNRL